MKKLFLTVLLLSIFLITKSQAQLNLPQGSPKAEVSQKIGISDISITYSRPSVNGRAVWGNLVPYGMAPNNFGTAKEIPWRAGANENTAFITPVDVKIEGQALAAGTYGLHMIPEESGDVTLIFSDNATSWGSFFYDVNEDALRVKVKMMDAEMHEQLTYDFENVKTNEATLALYWEKKKIPFKIELNTPEVVMDQIRNDLRNNKGFVRQNWEQAANYALNNGYLEDAEKWADAAITGNFFSQETYQNLSLKSQILAKKGDKTAAVETMDKAIGMANTNQLNQLGYQLLGNQNYEKALEVFHLNVKNNPTDANVHDSLGEAYKIMGDKENAVKYLKMALGLNPAENVKANSIKLLNELGVKP